MGIIALTDKLNAVINELAEIKRAFTSPDSVVNKKFAEVEVQLHRQSEIIAQQQRFLRKVDRREREINIVILGVPDEQEALDGAVTDQDKLGKVWEKVGRV